MLTREGRRLDTLAVVFCSDPYLLNINKDFLGHKDLTDIITFDLSDHHLSAAEIYISVDRVKDNARTFRVPVINEIHRVIFHGVLHLCGYKDKKPADAKVIRAMEDKYLQEYFTRGS
jgi:rRNA maturation RNase YbeY